MAFKPNFAVSCFLKSTHTKHNFYIHFKRFMHLNRDVEQLRCEYLQLSVNRVFILEKLTKYDIEIRNGYTPDQILHKFPLAFCTHITHKKIMSALIKLLNNKYNIHSTVVKAQTSGLTVLDENSAFPPDAIISAGGDGTFLEAASLIPPRTYGSRGFWLFGLNTDPERSLGTLCISYPNQSTADNNMSYDSKESCSKLNSARRLAFKFIDLNYGLDDRSILSEVTEFCNLDKFEFSQCDRFQPGSPQTAATFDGEELIYTSNSEPATLVKTSISLQNFHELTTSEYVDTILNKLLVAKTCIPILRQRIRIKVFPRDSYEIEQFGSSRPTGYVYPFGAINDVIIADESFGKTFYAFIQVDNRQVYKVKCSGVLVSTGTGSTAWAYNVSKLSINTIKNIVNLLVKNTGNSVSDDAIKSTFDQYDKSLTFPPSDNMLKCIIREPIEDGQGFRLGGINEENCFMAKKIKIRALSRNSKLYLDGSKCIDFHSGDTVVIAAFSADVIHSCL